MVNHCNHRRKGVWTHWPPSSATVLIPFVNFQLYLPSLNFGKEKIMGKFFFLGGGVAEAAGLLLLVVTTDGQ